MSTNLTTLQLNYLDALLTLEREHSETLEATERLKEIGKMIKAASGGHELTDLEQIYRAAFNTLDRENAESGRAIARIHRIADMIRAANGQAQVNDDMRAAFSCGPGCK